MILFFIDDNEELWNEDDSTADDFEPERVSPEQLCETNKNPQSFVLVKWIVGFISFMQASYQLSDMVVKLWLKFLAALFGVLGRISEVCHALAQALPSTTYKFHAFTGSNDLNFTRYVVCRTCHHIYLYHQCVETGNKSKRCSFKAFPNHPHLRMRQPCNTLLLKTVELASGRKLLYPFMSYCYMSLTSSLSNLLQHPDFNSLCEEWRHRNVINGVLSDVYDGQVWKDFQKFEDVPFLSEPFSYALMINVDWFQPYTHTQYSIGAIYVTILNLPRHVRNKKCNIILIGIMPGPREPSKTMNSFIEPLIEELKEFWQGKNMKVHGFSSEKLVRCALLSAACDLPAGRKLCGFLSYNACFGCTRCWKKFSGGVGCQDFSGFDREKWSARTVEEHRDTADKLLLCNTKNELSELESSTGFRITALLELPYFNPSRMLVIDPMHNLFLGTAKHFIKSIWLDQSVLSYDKFDLIQSRINKVVVPSDIGRIPYKIASGFSSFTADQFKNWVVYYSLLALRNLLTDEHLECWRHFVLCCRLLCAKAITTEKAKLADALLLQFCKRTQRLYGQMVITPNMHLHAHLHDCIIDFGPAHTFWLYSFERFNGILGKQPNNNRSIEVQMMARFLRDCYQASMPLPQEFNEDFAALFPSRQVVGSVSEALDSILPPLLTPVDIEATPHWDIGVLSHIKLPSHCTRGVLTTTELNQLEILYSRLYKVPASLVKVNQCFLKYKSILMYGKQIGTHLSRSSSSSILMCSWNSIFTATNELLAITSEERPARIEYFAQLTVTINDATLNHLLFSASWFKCHPRKNAFGKPVSVWECDVFDVPALSSLVPVQFINRRTVSLIDKLDDVIGQVLYIIPCIDF